MNESIQEDEYDKEDDEKDEDLNSMYLSYPNIPLHLDQPQGSWSYSPLFKTSQTGGTLVWQIGFDDTTNEMVMIHGQYQTKLGKSGQIQETRRRIETNNSGLNLQEQARLEAQKKRIDKYRLGYRPFSNQDQTKEPAACLLTEYVQGKSIKEADLPIAIQAKVDGMRCRIFVRYESDEEGNVKDKIVMLSRTTVEWKWLEHIHLQVAPLFEWLPKEVGLDGELYLEGQSFERLQTALRTTKTKDELNDHVKLYIFDLILLNTILEDRASMLTHAMASSKEAMGEDFFSHIYVMPMYQVDTFKELNEQLKEFEKQGHEGLVVRKFGRYPDGSLKPPKKVKESFYLPSRNNNTQKVKSWKDAEGTIVDVTQGEGSHEGLAIFTLKIDTKEVPITFQCVPNGTAEERRNLYMNRKKLIGKLYTYKFFEYMESGAPRFPKGLRFFQQ